MQTLADHRHAPELLAGVDVGQVHLDRGQPGDLERVADRPRVVRPRARVEDQAVREVARLVELLARTRPRSRSGRTGSRARARGPAPDPLLEPQEGQAAVVLGGPAVELVEVDPVHHRDAVLHDRPNSATAARRSSGATAIAVRTSPGASTSAKPTRPRRFLSRAVAATTSAGSIAGSRRVGRPRGQQLRDLLAQRRLAGQRERREQAEPDRLAVAVARVARRRLDRVPDGVAEVEALAGAGVALVGGHDRELRARARQHEVAVGLRGVRTRFHSGPPAISAVLMTSA